MIHNKHKYYSKQYTTTKLEWVKVRLHEAYAGNKMSRDNAVRVKTPPLKEHISSSDNYPFPRDRIHQVEFFRFQTLV